MGCDIHSFCEIFNETTGKWEKTGKIFPNPWYDKDKPNKIDEDGYEWNAEFIHHPIRNRNYDLFAMLADVRNGRGFAGIKTGEGFNIISPPKGIPVDASKEVMLEYALRIVEEENEEDEAKTASRSYASKWAREGTSKIIELDGVEYVSDPDAHSESYLTVKELDAFAWNQVTLHRGIVSFKEYKELKEKGETQPESWCGSISGPGIKIITEKQADFLIKNGIPEEGKNDILHVDMNWASPYSDSAHSFINKTLPLLRSLGKPENVRLVFWFDN